MALPTDPAVVAETQVAAWQFIQSICLALRVLRMRSVSGQTRNC